MRRDDTSADEKFERDDAVGEVKSHHRSRSSSPPQRQRVAKASSTGTGAFGIADDFSKIVDRLADQVTLQQKELNAIRETQRTHSEQLSSLSARSPRKSHPPQPSHALASMEELAKLDWRLALGELSMNLRRELADKVGREEMFSTIRMEMDTTEKRLHVSDMLPVSFKDRDMI